ncbi:MAG TPA: hypothetical protein VKW06_05380 [Candidatus Angelobacter sp.]|nr:hypothetical protein [Candidatus Angelobacter sp.]
MKSQVRKFLARFVVLSVAVTMCYSARALAQFEVSPDHFESNPPAKKQQAAKSVKPATRTAAHSVASKANSKTKTQTLAQATVASGGSGGATQGQPQAGSTSAKPGTRTAQRTRKKRAAAANVVLARTP